jgi:thiol:disulfide interchange protein
MADSVEILPEKPLSTGQWFVTLLILGLPLIGLIMMIVWALGDGHQGRRNFCRASLLWFAIVFGLALLATIATLIFGGTLAALFGQGVPR